MKKIKFYKNLHLKEYDNKNKEMHYKITPRDEESEDL